MALGPQRDARLRRPGPARGGRTSGRGKLSCAGERLQSARGTLSSFSGGWPVMVPRPRINLILYHGVRGPRAAPDALRWFGVSHPGLMGMRQRRTRLSSRRMRLILRRLRGVKPASRRWASLMALTFGFDVFGVSPAWWLSTPHRTHGGAAVLDRCVPIRDRLPIRAVTEGAADP